MAARLINGVSNDPYVDSLLSGWQWDDDVLTFNFPDSVEYYGEDYSPTGEVDNFDEAPEGLQDAVRWALFEQFARVADLTFQEVGPNDDAILSVAQTALPDDVGRGFLPNDNQAGGDSWFLNSDIFEAPLRGERAWKTVMHELGHTLGLKHPHEAAGVNGLTMPPDRDSSEFSVMSYHSYISVERGEPGNERVDYPQSLMMYDIRALQQMYGANFDTNRGNTTYTFSATTGEMFVNGVGQGAPVTNRVFLTIWDGNGIDTYDFSNYTTNLQVDLAPGGWSKLSDVQLADLEARGNVFNALQFNGDARSLIENARGGSGDDTLKGNAAANTLRGNGGNDTLDGKGGADWLYGGGDNDTYFVDNVGDRVIELASAGTDLVKSWLSFTLPDNVEHLTLIGRTGFVAPAGGTLTGNGLGNQITGHLGDDRLNGLGGRDTLRGSDGRDVLNGGAEADVLTGGSGTDRFVFRSTLETAANAPDTITDFTRSSGYRRSIDIIDVSAIDANSVLPANPAFAFIGAGAFSGRPGELRYSRLDLAGTANDRTTIELNVNTDIRADAAIVLFGLHNLATWDFVL